jgi:acetyl-CoA C-acetyltransferase
MLTQHDIVLAAGLRLPQARAGGAFKREDAAHMGAVLTRELLARTGLAPDAFDEVLAGCVGQPHDQANLARVIALRAGLPEATPAYTVARNCASGMEAVTSAVTQIMAGRGSSFLCLGVETMSAYPLLFNQKATDFFGRLAFSRSLGAKLGAIASWRPSMLAPRIALLEGLTDPTNDMIMGSTAELLARDFGLTRNDADTYAAESHTRAAAARDAGRYDKEIMPYFPKGASKKQKALVADDSIRDGQSVEALGKLRPYFEKPDGVVTVGNACGITDGATALVVTTGERACDPARMGLGPVFSTARCLEGTGVTLDDIGTIELNEAFAVQVLACRKAFGSAAFAEKHLGRSTAMGGVPLAKLNPNGGAIAIGHPVGATGARLLLTTALELEAGDHELGLATLCIGGGQGGAVLLERYSS